MSLFNLAAAVGAVAALSVTAFCGAEAYASKGNLEYEPDYLLILGCRVKEDQAQPTLITRINAAADFLIQHKNTKAICCGGIVHPDQTKSEAQAVKEGLIAAGVGEDRIILEDKSTTTKENFANAAKIIEQVKTQPKPKIAFLSSEFHLLRSGFIAKLSGISAQSIAAPSPKNERVKNYLREFVVFPGTIIDSITK